MHTLAPRARLWLALALLVSLLAAALAPARTPVRGEPTTLAHGLRVSLVDTPAGRAVRVVSPERFELVIDGGGIVAWLNLAAPEQNLVAPGAHLLEHRSPDGALFRGAAQLVSASPVRAVVHLVGAVGQQPATLVYSIWAGGQVSVETLGAVDLGTELRLAPESSSGAALRQLGSAAMLFLAAWVADEALPGDTGVVMGASLATTPQLDATTTLVAVWSGTGELRLTPPDGVLRQPRFRIVGWPGPQVSVALAGRSLVAGADYIADWEAASGELTLQYLGLLAPGGAAGRTFTLGLEQAPALSVEILNQDGSAARSLSPEGLLRVDANVPSQVGPAPGVPTTKDIFDIPYIQTWRDLRLRATVANPPVGFGGVRFTVIGPSFTRTVDDATPADGFSAQVTLPRRAEYSVVVSSLVNGQPAEPSRTLAKAAFGRVFVSVGDSITAGQWGFYRFLDDPGYPFTVPPAAGAGIPVSGDGRNYPQSDNFADELVGGAPIYENPYFSGYLPELNDALTVCLNSPVFVLNDGSSGILTARDRYKPGTFEGRGAAGYKNVLGKAAAIRSHLRQLGAGQILLQTGTNDATKVISDTATAINPMPASVYNQELRDVITALRTQDSALNLWVARLPWRADKRLNDPAEVPAQRQAKTQEFNAEIVSVVDSLGAANPIYFGPDFYSHFAANQGQIITTNPVEPSRTDLLHPTVQGFTAMANLWAQAICQQIAPEPPPDPVGCGEPGQPACPDPRPFKLRLPLLRS